MYKPTNTPTYYFLPITRRPTTLPHFKTTLPTITITTIPTIANTTTTIPTIVNTITILKASTTIENKLSQSNIIIIVSVSTFFIICMMVICFKIYDKIDKKRREKQFHHWLTQDANITIYSPY